MSLFLSSLPVWLSFLIVVVLPTAVVISGQHLMRRKIPTELLAANNEVAGFKFAVVGIVYAVLLGFAVIVVWERYHDAETAVAQETSGVISLWRLAKGFDSETAAPVEQRLTDYVRAAIDIDWPAMAQGRGSTRVGDTLSALYATVLAIRVPDQRQAGIQYELLLQLDTVTQARRTRLLLADGTIPRVLWAVLLTGACVTLGYTFFFGAPSIRAQLMMSAMLVAIVCMVLWALIGMEHPFTGPVSVEPTGLHIALTEFLNE
jgi:Protein of unknown function (DUF4239)